MFLGASSANPQGASPQVESRRSIVGYVNVYELSCTNRDYATPGMPVYMRMKTEYDDHNHPDPSPVLPPYQIDGPFRL